MDAASLMPWTTMNDNADKTIQAMITQFNAQPASAPLRKVPTARERLHQRTRELAVLAGRQPLQVTKADYEQAKQEVTGETSSDRQNLILDPVV